MATSPIVKAFKVEEDICHGLLVCTINSMIDQLGLERAAVAVAAEHMGLIN